MRSISVLACLAASSLVWADGVVGVNITVGWDGSHPVGWETWSVETRAQHEARMTQERAELGVWFETHRRQHPDTQWNAELAFGLVSRSVNAGFSLEVAKDIVHTVVVEEVAPEHAYEIVRTTVVEAVAAEAEDADPSDDEDEYRNLGQWVKAQVHSGLKGKELAAAIHERIKERKDEKKAEKEAKKKEKAQGKGKHDPTAKPEDAGKGKPEHPGKGKGKGRDKDK